MQFFFLILMIMKAFFRLWLKRFAERRPMGGQVWMISNSIMIKEIVPLCQKMQSLHFHQPLNLHQVGLSFQFWTLFRPWKSSLTSIFGFIQYRFLFTDMQMLYNFSIHTVLLCIETRIWSFSFLQRKCNEFGLKGAWNARAALRISSISYQRLTFCFCRFFVDKNSLELLL